MSIWSSLDGAPEPVSRDNYTGQPEQSFVHAPFVDVATATWFHECIRLVVEPSEVLLTADEALALADTLRRAADLVRAEAAQ